MSTKGTHGQLDRDAARRAALTARRSAVPAREARQENTADQPTALRGNRAQSVRLGVVGLGIMGSAMAANLMRAGYTVVGYDVSPAGCDAHRAAGGRVARSCKELGTRADVVVCSLPSSEALLETANALAGSRRARVVVETSTLPIDVKSKARTRLRAAGVTLLDCPLSGTGSQARTRDLVVLASGSRSAYRQVSPVLDAFARAHHYVGAFGAGSKMKFVANLLVAIHNVAAAEALVLAMKAGLDPDTTLRIVADGAGSSKVLQLRGPMMVQGRYSDATMKLGVFQKDLAIIGDFARGLGVATPLFSAGIPVYRAALAAGREAEDTAAVCAVLEQMSGHRRSARRGAPVSLPAGSRPGRQ